METQQSLTGTGKRHRRMSTRGLCELTLESRDHRAIARFYQEALGLPLLAEEDDRVWLACGHNSRLGLWSVGEKEFGDRGGRHVHFAFSVPHGELGDTHAACRSPARRPADRSSTTEATSRCTSRIPTEASSRRGTSSRTATARTTASPR